MSQQVLSSTTALLLLVIFSIIWIAFGLYLGRKNKTLSDTMLAGRNVGFALAAATAMATWVTSNTTMTAPQLTYQLGIWGMIGYSLGAMGLILFAPLAMRIKYLLPNAYTSGDFIRSRFGKTAWRVFLMISFFYAFGWLISLGMAGGILVNTLSGLPYELGMSIILLTCVSYTLFGGLRAVIATDFLQTLIIIFGVCFIAYLVLQQHSVDTIYQEVRGKQPMLLNLLFPAAIMFLFNNLFFGVGEIFHSNVWWSRAFAFSNNVGKKAFLIAGIFWIPVPIVAGFIALTAVAMGLVVPSADMVGPMVVSNITGKIGSIIFFIVVFSALASSLDSLLAATTDLVTQDIYRGHINQSASDEDCYRMSKWIVILLGFGTWLLCLPKLTTLASLLYFTGAFVASTIWPIVFGLYYKWVSGKAASIAMISGTICGLAAYFIIGFYVAALVSSAVSLLSILIFGKLYPECYQFSDLSLQEKA